MTIKPFLLSLCGAAALLGTAAARADMFSGLNIQATDDLYVDTNDTNDTKTNFGSLETIRLKSDHSGDVRATGILKFAVSRSALPVNYDASLLLDIDSVEDGKTHTFYLFQSQESCGSGYSEETTRYVDVAGLDKSADGINNGSACIAHGGQPLATFTVGPGQVASTVAVSSAALTQAVAQSSTGQLTFFITQYGNLDKPVRLASKEHPSLKGPRLALTVALAQSELTAGGLETYVSRQADGSYNLTGKLKIPTIGQQFIELDDANVDMEFDAAGRLKSLSGAAMSLPRIPGLGLLGRIAQFSSTANRVEVGYGRLTNALKDHFGDHEIPLDADKSYFYFLITTGDDIQLGPITASSPNTGSTLLIVEPNGPTAVFYSDMTNSEWLNDAAAGFSGSNSLKFIPLRDNGVESYMAGLYGDLYLAGSVNIPTDIPKVYVNATGDLFINTDDGRLDFTRTGAWMKDVGVNGQLALETTLGDYIGLSLPLSETSALYRRKDVNGRSSLVFSGKMDPDKLQVGLFDVISTTIPISSGGTTAKVSGYLAGDSGTVLSSASFLNVGTRLVFGGAGSFITQRIDANLRVTDSGVTMDGTAKFGGASMKVSGLIDPGYAKFGGKLKTRFNVDIASVEMAVTADFDTRGAKVGLKAEGKACADGLGCQSVSSPDATLTLGGDIKVCAKIPFDLGRQCVTVK